MIDFSLGPITFRSPTPYDWDKIVGSALREWMQKQNEEWPRSGYTFEPLLAEVAMQLQRLNDNLERFGKLQGSVTSGKEKE